MRGSIMIALGLVVVLVAPMGAGAGMSLEVNTCGQIVPNHALGFLTADLDSCSFHSRLNEKSSRIRQQMLRSNGAAEFRH